jgi:hypothetical protein
VSSSVQAIVIWSVIGYQHGGQRGRTRRRSGARAPAGSVQSGRNAMPRFKGEIAGEGLDRTQAVLNSADIPTLGPYILLPRPGEESSPREVTVGRQMWAVLDAVSAEAAEVRVKQALAEADWNVQPAEPSRA